MHTLYSYFSSLGELPDIVWGTLAQHLSIRPVACLGGTLSAFLKLSVHVHAVISSCSPSWVVLPSSVCQYQLQFHWDKLWWIPLKWQGKHKESRSPQRAPGIPYLLPCLRALLLLCTLRDCIDSSWPSAVSPLWLTLVQPMHVSTSDINWLAAGH